MPESSSQKKIRARKIIHILEKTYPDAKCSLRFRTVFELLVAVILSAQCTDRQVNKITPRLFRLLPDPQAFAEAPISKIETLIHSTGFYKNKAKNLQAAARQILVKHDGQVPQTMKELVDLAGVGRKTANVILETGYGTVEGVVVDTHVNRITIKRWQLVPKKLEGKAEKTERELMKILPRNKWGDFAHVLISHGRQICTARRPKCHECPVMHLCPGRGI